MAINIVASKMQFDIRQPWVPEVFFCSEAAIVIKILARDLDAVFAAHAASLRSSLAPRVILAMINTASVQYFNTCIRCLLDNLMAKMRQQFGTF